MVTKALLVRLEALPGKEAELANFLTGARSIVMEEPGTIAWFAIQFGPSTFGVYDVFPDDEARDAHLAGGVGQALGPNTGVLFSEPQIEKIDIIADKLRGNRLRAWCSAVSGVQRAERARPVCPIRSTGAPTRRALDRGRSPRRGRRT